MGFFAFIKGLFTPSSEQLNTEKQERIRHILIVMYERYLRNRDDMPSLRIIYHELVKHGWSMPVQELTEMMQVVVDAGFVQCLDSGDKHTSPTLLHYVISSNGLNHLGYRGRWCY